MNNLSDNKGSKYRDKLSFKNRIDLTPTLTEKSTEKTLENQVVNNNSVSKKSFYKNTFTNTNMNKISKSSHLSEKDLINLNTQKSKSKENSKNKSLDLRYKNSNVKATNIGALFGDSLPKYLKNGSSKDSKLHIEMKREGKFIKKLSLEKKPKSYLSSLEPKNQSNSKELSPNFSTNFNDQNNYRKKISKVPSGVATPVHRYTRSDMNYKTNNVNRKVVPTVASLGSNINNIKNTRSNLTTKKAKTPSSNIINLQNHNLNPQNIYGVNQLSSTKNKAINSTKAKVFKNDILINNNFNNVNNIYTNNANNSSGNNIIYNNNNQNNLINLNGINISYSELAKHLHSRKNTATNTRAKNSNESSLEKMHSSVKKVNNFKQPSSFKILPMQNESDKTNYKEKQKEAEFEKHNENENGITSEKNVLLTQECFFDNSFKKKKRNASLKYNFTHGFNNISQIFKNSSSNLNTSNSNGNFGTPNLGGSYSFANNSKTTKENSGLNSMANTMKASNFFNFPTNNSLVNSSCINLNNKSSINFNCANPGNNRNAFSKSNFLNNLNNNNLLSYNDSTKFLNFGKTNNPNDIEGPEILHFFYVNILQQNKKLAYKFENCEEENSVVINENETHTFA